MPNDPTSRRGMKRKTMTRNQYHSVPRSISSSGDTVKESQFIRTELEILLPMRLQNGGDREMAFPGQAQIVVDIAARVDHHGEPVSAPPERTSCAPGREASNVEKTWRSSKTDCLILEICERLVCASPYMATTFRSGLAPLSPQSTTAHR